MSLLIVASALAFAGPSPIPSQPPAIAALLKPVVYKRMIDEREVMTSADLEDVPSVSGKTEKTAGLRDYRFYASMWVNASPAATRKVLTDYQAYAQVIPYIDQVHYSEVTKVLQIVGGIWKFKLVSSVQFEERSDRWIRYRIIAGHFKGLEGDILFEPAEEKGTAVLFRGDLRGSQWPPAFVLERGAEIVFGFTAQRMRTLIESKKKEEQPKRPGGSKNDDEIPQPRSRF